MKTQRKISTFVVLLIVSLIVSFNVSAEEVYERTNSQGVTEFSDKPSPDSEVIEVKPNVVDVVPPEPLAPRPSAVEPTRPASPKQGRVTEAVDESSNGSVYYDDDLRERHRKGQIIKEHRREGGEPVQHHRPKKTAVPRR